MDIEYFWQTATSAYQCSLAVVLGSPWPSGKQATDKSENLPELTLV